MSVFINFWFYNHFKVDKLLFGLTSLNQNKVYIARFYSYILKALITKLIMLLLIVKAYNSGSNI